jgi:hypothetical protein
MVLVSIDDYTLGDDSIVIEMDVFGAYPRGSREVMGILTRVFSKLSFDYFRVSDEGLSMLGYYLAMLARGKVFIASVPEDTHVLEHYPSLEQAVGHVRREGGREVVDIFVDVGSPFKNIYFVSRDDSKYLAGARGYRIIGRGYLSNSEIYIHADFAREPPTCTPVWCPTELLEREELIRDGELHIVPYPDMEDTKKALLERAIKLAVGKSA